MKTKVQAKAHEKYSNLTYENLLIIASFIGVKVNYNYVITDYSIVKGTVGNRGGFSNRRFNYYVNAIKNGTFKPDMSKIQIDIFGNICEGHHRFEAMKYMGLPIAVTIIYPKTLGEICTVNSGPNSKWYPEESFNSAITINCEATKILDEFRDKAIKSYGIERDKLTASEMYGIVIGNTKHFSAGLNSPTIDMWCEEKVLTLLKKRETKINLTFYARMKREFKNNRDAYKICKHVMDLHFNENVSFQLNVFFNALCRDGFVLDKYDALTIKAKAMSMYQKQIKRELIAV